MPTGQGLLLAIAGELVTTERQVICVLGQVTEVAKANPLRFAIGFQYQGGVRQTLTITGINDNTRGINLNFNDLIWLDVHKHGSLPMQAFNAPDNGAGQLITVYEVVYTGD